MDASLMEHDRDRPKHNPNAMTIEELMEGEIDGVSNETARRIIISFEHDITLSSRAETNGYPLAH